MTCPQRRVFLSLGSNQGDRAGYLAQARAALAALVGTEVLGASRVYETAPQDVADQPSFLNQVVCVATDREPRAFLHELQAVEAAAGRVRAARFGPRTLDVDILLIEGYESGDVDLTVPHPRMWQRAFVLVPLAELWSLARGMPAVDVPALACELTKLQAVEVYDERRRSR